jgi:hypothetical protein
MRDVMFVFRLLNRGVFIIAILATGALIPQVFDFAATAAYAATVAIAMAFPYGLLAVLVELSYHRRTSGREKGVSDD